MRKKKKSKAKLFIIIGLAMAMILGGVATVFAAGSDSTTSAKKLGNLGAGYDSFSRDGAHGDYSS